MTLYQFFLLAVLLAWPLTIFGVLFLMSRLENYVKRLDAADPEAAGLEPVEGTREREVKVFFGGAVVGTDEDGAPENRDTGPQPAAARASD